MSIARSVTSVPPEEEHGVVEVADVAKVAEEVARPGRRRAASSAFVAVMVGSLAMVVLHLLDREAGVGTWWLGSITIGVGLGVFGSVLALRVPDNPIGWLMVLGGLAQVAIGLGREWAVYSEVTRAGRLPGATFGAWFGSWGYLISIATLPLALLVFPDGRLPSRRWRAVVATIVVALVAGSVASMFVPGEFTEEMPTLVNPIGVESSMVVATAALAQFVMMGAIIAAAVSLVRRSHGATGVLRQQLKWITFAGAVLGVELAVELSPAAMWLPWFDWLGPFVLLFFLSSITMSVLRWHLWDIDVLISRSLVYGTSTVVLGGAFIGIVTVSGRLREHPIDYGSSLAAAAVVAVAFAPVRDYLQHRIDRRLYGDRSDAYRAMTRLGDRLGVPGSTDSVLDDVVDTLATSLRLDHVAIVSDDGATMATNGEGRGDGAPFPLRFRAGRVGTLVVAPRAGIPLGQRERAVLDGLAPLVAAVVRAVAATEELQRSRLALVTAREEERRRIRRDLHDGLGPALAAIRMKLDGAGMLVDRDPRGAHAVLDQLSDDIRTTIADIRHLVYDLRPPALDELGLESALRELARSFSGPTADGGYLCVDLAITDDVSSLPAACEVAAYRIVSECLTNVERHARATRCLVRVDLHGNFELAISIDDDGIGRPPTSADGHHGLGTRSMMERAAELGGDCEIERSPLGGTRIRARLPTGEPASMAQRATATSTEAADQRGNGAAPQVMIA